MLNLRMAYVTAILSMLSAACHLTGYIRYYGSDFALEK